MKKQQRPADLRKSLEVGAPGKPSIVKKSSRSRRSAVRANNRPKGPGDKDVPQASHKRQAKPLQDVEHE
jgi:hypothetical protein